MTKPSMDPFDFSAHSREAAIEVAEKRVFDVAVIGGGITGAGVLLDAASRGLSAILFEKNDFGSSTSSRSSRLIHGGLRYLDTFDLRVVYESLRERALLLKNAPHLVSAIPFVIPNFKNSFFDRNRRKLRAGLSLYDALGLPPRHMRHRRASKDELEALIPGIDSRLYDEGMVYWDAANDDARTCLSVLKTATRYGGIALNHCEVTDVSDSPSGLEISAHDHPTGSTLTVRARSLINATGVFADSVAERLGLGIRLPLVPARGAHLVIRKSAYPGEAAVLLPVVVDDRFIFVIPFDTFALVGTTDTLHTSDLEDPSPRIEEIRYLTNTFDRWSARPLEVFDISGAFAGLRPLVGDAHSAHTTDISRRHVIVKGSKRSVTVTGGKFTTYRKMAQSAVDMAASAYLDKPVARSVTHRVPLAGHCSYDWLKKAVISQSATWKSRRIPERELRALWRRYGSEAIRVLHYQREAADLAPQNPEEPWCFEGQVIHAIRHEAALSVEDIIWRRLRLGSDAFENAMSLAPRVASITEAELGHANVFRSDSSALESITEKLSSRRDLVAEAFR